MSNRCRTCRVCAAAAAGAAAKGGQFAGGAGGRNAGGWGSAAGVPVPGMEPSGAGGAKRDEKKSQYRLWYRLLAIW